MERNQRKTLVGRVVSDKMDKTITVATVIVLSILSDTTRPTRVLR